MDQLIKPELLKGVIHIPPSKSDSQRSILAAALSKGKSILTNVGSSEDEKVMLSAVYSFGAIINKLENDTYEIQGFMNSPESGTINVGESGLSARLMTCICATFKEEFEIIGKGSILNRPMYFFDEVFLKLGVEFHSQKGYLPFTKKGKMRSGELTVNASQSSQYISGLLMSLPMLEGDSNLKVENLKSIPYVQMTLNTLKLFGIEIQHDQFKRFNIKGNQKYRPINYTIEGDWSSASFWLVASALGAKISVQGLSMLSLQADKKILDTFISAECKITNSSEGISICGKKRKSFSFDATDCPDLFPALVTFASLTPGISRINGVHRLATKESDRGIVLKQEFKKLGIQIEIEEDEMVIVGSSIISGGRVSSQNDHRIAMCLAIAGLFAEAPLVIDHSEVVSKSYPNFWNDLKSLSCP